MRTVAWENRHKEQANMQKCYDKGATPRTLEVGDQVLALLPAGSGKLDTQWHGPYVITAQVSPVTYQVDMPEKWKRHRTFHVNMLKQWNSPVASVLAVYTEESDGQVGGGCEGSPTFVQQLSQTQVQELPTPCQRCSRTSRGGQQQQSTALTPLMHNLFRFHPTVSPRHGKNRCNRRSERCWIWGSSNHVGVHGHHQLWQ